MSTPFPPPPPEDLVNPYAAPATEIGSEPTGLGADGDLTEAEVIRRAHIGHEASVRSLGSLHYLGAVFGLIGSVGMLFMLFGGMSGGAAEPGGRMLLGGLLILYFGMTALNFALGKGLRGLKPWARWTDTALLSLQAIFAVLGSINALITGQFPAMIPSLIGLLIVGYILYLLLSQKGTVVFSPAYKEIIARTPHIKYRTSLLLKIVLALLVAMIGLMIVGALLSRR